MYNHIQQNADGLLFVIAGDNNRNSRWHFQKRTQYRGVLRSVESLTMKSQEGKA